jgi:hypothetical protein
MATIDCRLTGAFEHKDLGMVRIAGSRYDTYTISFVNRRGEVCMIYRSTAWVRRLLKSGDLVPSEGS